MLTKPKQHPDLDSLYCINPDGSRNTIHTADVRGRYQSRKKLIWAVLIAIYLVVPWIEIGGAPAVLFDIENRRFFLFGSTFDAQDFWLAFFVISGIGFTLFVVSALFGRIWCGYGCPHTVFLEGVFRRIERWFEGTAAQRKRLAEGPWLGKKLLIRSAKWGVYLGISLVLSHTMLGYFMPVRAVVAATTGSPAAHPTAFTFVAILTAIIYFNFAWFREQLCIVICPYGRLQGVLYDADTVNVGYDQARGEPRGKYTSETRGDCIDCYRCVAVCPTGIDIRNGTQLECIGCANCIDACDEVMAKLLQKPGLIRYDSQRGFERGERRFVRPRLFLYAALLLIGIAVFSVAATFRSSFEAMLTRQTGAAYTVDDDVVRNAFWLHLVNKQREAHTFEVDPVPIEGVEFIPPRVTAELAPFEDRRIPLFVVVVRDRFERGMAVDLAVRSALGEHDLRVHLVGPGADSRR